MHSLDMIKSANKFNKQTRQIGLGLGIVFIVVGLVYAWKNTRRSKSSGAKNAPLLDKSSTTPFRCISNSYPLSYGTCHPDVKIVQRHLKSLGANLGSYGNSGVDGRFGTLTLKAAQSKLGKSSFDQAAVRQMKERK